MDTQDYIIRQVGQPEFYDGRYYSVTRFIRQNADGSFDANYQVSASADVNQVTRPGNIAPFDYQTTMIANLCYDFGRLLLSGTVSTLTSGATSAATMIDGVTAARDLADYISAKNDATGLPPSLRRPYEAIPTNSDLLASGIPTGQWNPIDQNAQGFPVELKNNSAFNPGFPENIFDGLSRYNSASPPIRLNAIQDAGPTQYSALFTDSNGNTIDAQTVSGGANIALSNSSFIEAVSAVSGAVAYSVAGQDDTIYGDNLFINLTGDDSRVSLVGNNNIVRAYGFHESIVSTGAGTKFMSTEMLARL